MLVRRLVLLLSGYAIAVGLVLTAIMLVPALAGCEKTVQQRLQGRWVGEQAMNFPTPQLGAANGWAQGTSFEFHGSRVTVSITGES